MARFFFFSPTEFCATVLLAGMALVLAACGGGKPTQSSEAETESSSALDTIEVTMKDFAYQPSSITVPAGKEVTLQFSNTGSVEHYFVVGDTVASTTEGFQQNLFTGVSIEKSKQTEGHEEEEGEQGEGEEEEHHANEFELPPGGSGSMTFTLPPSKAGSYTIACFETTGNEKHYDMGMQGTLTVTASTEN